MIIYTKLSPNLKNKINLNIQKIINKQMLNELNQFHKKKLINNFINCFNKYNYLSDCFLIENTILFWLNHPYSQNMDNPFVTNKFTSLFISVLSRIFKQKEVNYILNSNLDNNYYNFKMGQSYLHYNYSKKYICNKILNSLTLLELESLYIYYKNLSLNVNNENIINISLKFNQ